MLANIGRGRVCAALTLLFTALLAIAGYFAFFLFSKLQRTRMRTRCSTKSCKSRRSGRELRTETATS
jgi:hypothetical protein